LQPLFLWQKNLGGRGSKVLSGQKRIVRRPNEGQTIAGQRICGWITQPPAFRISVLLAAIGLPGLFRIALNRAPFSGDESQYARASVELFRSLAKSPLEWLHLLITISLYKPSALLWLGHFFVPLGSWTQNGTQIWPTAGGAQAIAWNDQSGYDTDLDSISVSANDVIRF